MRGPQIRRWKEPAGENHKLRSLRAIELWRETRLSLEEITKRVAHYPGKPVSRIIGKLEANEDERAIRPPPIVFPRPIPENRWRQFPVAARLEIVRREVALSFLIPPDTIVAHAAKRKKRAFLMPARFALYLLSVEVIPNLPPGYVAARLGGIDRTTLIYGVAKAKAKINRDPSYAEQISAIRFRVAAEINRHGEHSQIRERVGARLERSTEARTAA